MRAPLDGLDLNLLLVLHTLLEEGSVTRAAARLGRSQPTVSRALADLRTTFQDPLFVRAGRGVTPTPFARALRAPLAQSLAALDHLRTVGDFDPAAGHRHFRLLLPDLVGGRLLADLLERTCDAPGVSFEVYGSEVDSLGALLRGDVDLVVSAEPAEHPELCGRRFEGPGLGWSIAVGPSHPGYARAPTVDEWLASPHLQVVPGGRPDVPGQLERLLRERGFQRFVRAQVTYVSAVPAALVRGGLVVSLPTPVCHWLAEAHDLAVHPHPLAAELGRLPLHANWHVGSQADAAHRWLRSLLVKSVAGLVG